jgi:hypothetical protein
MEIVSELLGHSNCDNNTRKLWKSSAEKVSEEMKKLNLKISKK